MATKGHYQSGTVEGTGAAINIELGFSPSYVRILNIDGIAVAEWIWGMADASAMKQVTAGTISHPTSNGISPYTGAAGQTPVGFTIGADADVNVSGETLFWVAWGEE